MGVTAENEPKNSHVLAWGDLLEWSPMPTVGWWDKLGAAGSEVGELLNFGGLM